MKPVYKHGDKVWVKGLPAEFESSKKGRIGSVVVDYGRTVVVTINMTLGRLGATTIVPVPVEVSWQQCTLRPSRKTQLKDELKRKPKPQTPRTPQTSFAVGDKVLIYGSGPIQGGEFRPQLGVVVKIPNPTVLVVECLHKPSDNKQIRPVCKWVTPQQCRHSQEARQ